MGPQWGITSPHRSTSTGSHRSAEVSTDGYADAAIASYASFKARKQRGDFEPGTRFQVGLPTPLGVLAIFMEPDAQQLSEPEYRKRIIEDIDRIASEIPHAELAIQFDVPEEIAVWEGMSTVFLDNPREAIIERLAELIDRVPRAAEVGIHICYGDVSHKHFKEPNLQVMADFSKAIVSAIQRPLSYIHLPVPRGWTEPAQYAALRDMRFPETRIYLGLIHKTDGVPGAMKRIGAARQHLQDFGVATPCGLGRRQAAEIPELLELHRKVSELT